MDIDLRVKADEIRLNTFKNLHHAGGGHFGGCMSCVEVLTALYYRVMHFDPQRPGDPGRDRFILSKGHAGPTLYTILADIGCIDAARLPELDQNGGSLPKHVDRIKVEGIEFSSGPLGQGISVAAGMAAGLKHDYPGSRVYCLLGDGECNEGQVWEAAMSAAHYQLDNLIAIVDWNHNQIDGPTNKVMNLDPFAGKWESFGWQTRTVDGHDVAAVAEALEQGGPAGIPTVVIADTVKGKGISFMEGVYRWHSGYLSKEQYETGLRDLELGRVTA